LISREYRIDELENEVYYLTEKIQDLQETLEKSIVKIFSQNLNFSLNNLIFQDFSVAFIRRKNCWTQNSGEI